MYLPKEYKYIKNKRNNKITCKLNHKVTEIYGEKKEKWKLIKIE